MIKTIKLGETFDDYMRAARIYPALITLLPAFLASLAVINGLVLDILWPLLVSAGFVYLLSHIARSLGKRLEVKLIREWNGIATTHLLRFSETENELLLNMQHKQLASFAPDIPIPTKAEEAADPSGSDKAYIAAIKLLSSYARERKNDYPRVHEEVISYGFRRNLMGLKAIALTVLSLSTVLEIVVCFTSKLSALRISCIIVQIALGIFWLSIVNSSWVYQAAELYAARLFDALNEISSKNAG